MLFSRLTGMGFRKVSQNLSVMIMTRYQGASYRQDVSLWVLTQLCEGCVSPLGSDFPQCPLQKEVSLQPTLKPLSEWMQVRLLIVGREFTDKQGEESRMTHAIMD